MHRQWIHGHTHASCDYRLGATRVVCNPAGYHCENVDFNPRLVIEVGVGEAASRKRERQ